jgi:hypothetical protein
MYALCLESNTMKLLLCLDVLTHVLRLFCNPQLLLQFTDIRSKFIFLAKSLFIRAASCRKEKPLLKNKEGAVKDYAFGVCQCFLIAVGFSNLPLALVICRWL